MLFAGLDSLNGSELISPALQSIHIAGFVFSIGTIALTDFSMLGLVLRGHSPSGIAKSLMPWTLVGFTLVLLSGGLLFMSDPDEYYLNRAFQVKMTFLLLALIFHYTLHARVARKDAPSVFARLVALISLGLWVGVLAGGIFIGFA